MRKNNYHLTRATIFSCALKNNWKEEKVGQDDLLSPPEQQERLKVKQLTGPGL